MTCKGLVIGIDAGGTHTRCLVADHNGQYVGSSYSGPGNYFRLGLLGMVQRIIEVVHLALPGATDPVDVLCIGAAGLGRSEDRAALAQALSAEELCHQQIIETDAYLALMAGTLGAPGVVVVAGTGSITLGVATDGTRARAGGWGCLLGDEGSGYDIGRQALSAIYRAADGRGPATTLFTSLLAKLRMPSLDALIQLIYGQGLEREIIAALAPVVANAASAGDQMAVAILETAGKELAYSAEVVHKRLHLLPEAPIVQAGGVFQLSTVLNTAFSNRLNELLPHSDSFPAPWAPVVGAIALALRYLGKELTTQQATTLTKFFEGEENDIGK